MRSTNDESRGSGGRRPADAPVREGETIARRLLDVVRDVAIELRPHLEAGLRVTLDSSLESDLGFDSLGRVELLMRLERAFKTQLPESLLSEAETPADLLAAVLRGAAAEPLMASREIRELSVGPVEDVPTGAESLIAVLDWHAARHPDRTHIALYTESDQPEEIGYRSLREGALAVAAGLAERGIAKGDSVAIMLPTERSFFEALFGVLYAGGVPVPIYPPLRVSQIEDHLRRQAGILKNAEARLLISPPQARAVSTLLRAQVSCLRGIETVVDLASGEKGGSPSVAADVTALLQYTSGSTGQPKGVVLSHGNLLSNIRAMGRAMEVDSSDVFVSWLPLYHDMGLIGAWLGSLYHAVPVVIMTPLRFLARPEAWLWAVHRHRGTLSAAPNFAFELCLRKIDDADVEGLDLRSLRMVINGAEPVSASTVRRFCRRFARYGFRAEAMAPTYGLAESSVGLAFPPPGRPPVIDRVERQALVGRGEARAAAPDDETALEIVACGRPLPGHQIRVVDATGREVVDRHEGRLQFRGPSTTRGYFRNEAKTRELFDDGWLESGDLAYVAGGDVYVTGRTKDLIIRAGRNIHPHEVEEAVGDIPGVRKGCVAVFGSLDARSGTERVVVLAETRERDPRAQSALRERIDEVTAMLIESPPDDVVLAPPHTVLKTSSGKIRRAASRELYESGAVGRPARAAWLQILRLAWAGVRPQLRRGGRAASDFLYAGYWWTVLVFVAAVAWPLIATLPRLAWRRGALRQAARAILALTRTPLRVEGVTNLPDRGGVLVANHASYLDGLALAASLPAGLCFVAKRELAGQLVAGIFLRRLGALFVERVDPERGVEDTRASLEAARRGERVVFFPEGRLLRTPGLLAFHMGAFSVAAEAGVPVVPVSLRGTRSILRCDVWFPRRGEVSVLVGKPIQPRGDGWTAAVHLRDAARAEMLWMCGEPDLAAE